MDKFAALHLAAVRTQPQRVAIIEDLQDMASELLKKYYIKTGLKPQRIIFYRDGVSEGQFQAVLDHEITALKAACEAIEQGYAPTITFIVVQKNHHVRFFPVTPSEGDRSGNVKAGTVMETAICHPTDYDFYLMSHSGIQGTSRPAHYHVLLDENSFKPDDLQLLTYYLCHIYVRCTKSVGVVPAVYYAHLIAARSRFFLEDNSDNQSMASVASMDLIMSSLKDVHSDLENVMYYA